MKVIMKKYPDHNAYMFVRWVFFFLPSDHSVIEWAFDHTPKWIKKMFDAHYKWRMNRRIKVRIDPWDVWNVDDTLAHIIVPLLKQLRNNDKSYGMIDEKDAPEGLSDEERWNYVLDEMIWSFEQHTTEWEYQFHNDDGYDLEKANEYDKRMLNGRMLFAKYYNALWT